jgi:hypothetical protein
LASGQQILVKVDRPTKARMRKVKVNWSAEIRAFINRRINAEKNMALAVLLSDRILNSRKKTKDTATGIIRNFRDARYGANSG